MTYINIKLIFESQGLKQIMTILNSTGKSSRLIGGCVRDKILNYPTDDIDIATQLLPEEVIQLCQQHKIKVIPTGVKFGTVTAMVGNEKFEITTLRKDIECYGRHVQVEFTEDFALDAIRRDFTINALSYDLIEQRIYDYCHGFEDFQNSKVVFIGNALERIKEDYLRILRFFRFSGRYANILDSIGYNACVELKDGLKLLSRERIIIELDKILQTPQSMMIIEAMINGNFFHTIDSRLQLNFVSFQRVYYNSKTISIIPTLETKYAALLSNIPSKYIKDILVQLRMSNVKISSIMELINPSTNLNYLWFQNPLLWQQKILLLTALDELPIDQANNILESFSKHQPQDFPINGDMLLELGFKNIILKQILNHLKEQWIDSKFTFKKDDLIKIANNYDIKTII